MTNQIQKYVLSLALLAASAELELFLREGCLLRYADEKDEWKSVPRRGEPKPVTSFPSRSELERVAADAAKPFKEKWRVIVEVGATALLGIRMYQPRQQLIALLNEAAA